MVGSSDFNFAEAAQLLDHANARSVVADEHELVEVVTGLLAEPAKRTAMGEAAQRVLAENRGALRRQLDVIEQALGA